MNIVHALAMCSAAEAHRVASEWFASFARAWTLRQRPALEALLLDDSHWRDILAMTWSLRTTSRAVQISSELVACAEQHPPTCLALDVDAYPPQFVERAGQRCVEFFARFETPAGSCLAVVRLLETGIVETDLAGDSVRSGGGSGAGYRAWTLMTALTQLAGQANGLASAPEKLSDIQAPNWLDRRLAERAFDGHEPDVLIVGGGTRVSPLLLNLDVWACKRLWSIGRLVLVTTGDCVTTVSNCLTAPASTTFRICRFRTTLRKTNSPTGSSSQTSASVDHATGTRH